MIVIGTAEVDGKRVQARRTIGVLEQRGDAVMHARAEILEELTPAKPETKRCECGRPIDINV
jgi:hypothetical protein